MLSTEEDSGESGFRSFLSRWRALERSGSPAGSTLNDPRNVNVGLRRRVAVISVLFLCAVGGATWYLVNLGQQRLIEIKALDVAEVVARLSTSSRSVYAEHVVRDPAGAGASRHRLRARVRRRPSAASRLTRQIGPGVVRGDDLASS